jgi:4'-phosphopantetheinyl transferase
MSSTLAIYACHIDKRLPEKEINQLLEFIDPAKNERILRFRNWQDAHLSLFADLLVRVAAWQREKIRNRDITFFNDVYGKPVFSSQPHIHFNVSLSGRWVVCGIDSSETGIDIERIDDVDLSLSEHFFSADEHKDILGSIDPLGRFFDYWTLKESYLKFVGKGLSEPLNSFTVCLLPHDRIQIRIMGVPVEGVHFKQYYIAEGYKLAVCCKHRKFPAECIFTTQTEIGRIIKKISD